MVIHIDLDLLLPLLHTTYNLFLLHLSVLSFPNLPGKYSTGLLSFANVSGMIICPAADSFIQYPYPGSNVVAIWYPPEYLYTGPVCNPAGIVVMLLS